MNLVDRIYESAFMCDLWPGTLAQIAEIPDGMGAALFSISHTDQRWLATESLKPAFEAFLSERWHERNPRPSLFMKRNHAGFITEMDIYNEDEFLNEPLYREFLAPRGIGREASTCFLMPTGDLVVLSIQRYLEKGTARRKDIRSLDALRPHIGRAALIAARLGLEQVNSRAAALGQLGIPAGAIARSGGLVAANQLLESLVPAVLNDGPRRLALTDRIADEALKEAIAQLASSLGGSRSIALRSSGEHAPAILHILPIRGSANDIFQSAAAMIALTPIDMVQAPSEALLHGLFDLSPAEARVARAFHQQRSISQAAAQLQVSRETVRSQLKQVFLKTGSGGQVDLIALLSTLGTVRPE